MDNRSNSRSSTPGEANPPLAPDRIRVSESEARSCNFDSRIFFRKLEAGGDACSSRRSDPYGGSPSDRRTPTPGGAEENAWFRALHQTRASAEDARLANFDPEKLTAKQEPGVASSAAPSTKHTENPPVSAGSTSTASTSGATPTAMNHIRRSRTRSRSRRRMGRGYVYLEDGTIDPNPVYLTDDEYREMVEKADWDYGGSGRFGIPRD